MSNELFHPSWNLLFGVRSICNMEVSLFFLYCNWKFQRSVILPSFLLRFWLVELFLGIAKLFWSNPQVHLGPVQSQWRDIWKMNSYTSPSKVWVKKTRHVKKLAVNKKSTFFILSSWNLVKIITSWLFPFHKVSQD